MFGEIREVTVEAQQGFALVQFSDIVAAFFAQQSLNNFYLNKYNASLSVKWLIKKENEEEDRISNQENILHQTPVFYPTPAAYSYQHGTITMSGG